eukprot:14826888-Alexandrium_andersonii.AAC.1
MDRASLGTASLRPSDANRLCSHGSGWRPTWSWACRTSRHTVTGPQVVRVALSLASQPADPQTTPQAMPPPAKTRGAAKRWIDRDVMA